MCVFTDRIWAATASDGLGNQLTTEQPLQRIISLSPALTDMLFTLGAENMLVGTLGSQRVSIPSVGSVSGLDYERIVRLRPQLVLAWHGGTPQPWIARLRQLGLTVFVSKTERLAQIGQTLRALGVLTARPHQRLADNFDKRLASLQQRFAGKPAVDVFYQVWANPLMTLNNQHIISDAIRTCGGRNLFADRPNLVVQITREAVVAARPQVIVSTIPGGAAAKRPTGLEQWQRFTGIPAVKNKHLVVLQTKRITRPTVKMLDAVDTLCQALDAAR